MQEVIESYAFAIAERAGNGYNYDVKTGKKRAYANIYPETEEARKDNFENNTLEKVIRS